MLGTPSIVRYANNQGLLTVKSHDSNVLVTLIRDGEKELVARLDANSVRRFNIDAGSYQVELSEPQPGSQTRLKTIVISRGERVNLRVADVPYSETILEGPGQQGLGNLGLIGPENPNLVWVLGDNRLRHWNWITSLAVDHDRDRLLSGSWDSTAAVWSLKTGEKLFSMEAHEYEVLDVAFGPHQHYLATIGADKFLKVWNADNGKLFKTIPLEAMPNTVRFCPWKKSVATTTRNSFEIWNFEEGELEFTTPLSPELTSASVGFDFCPNDTLAAIRQGNKIQILDVESSNVVSERSFADSAISAVRYSSDGTYLAVGFAAPQAKVLILDRSLTERFSFNHDNILESVLSLDFSVDGKSIAAAFGKGRNSEESELTPNLVRQFSLTSNQNLPSIAPRVYNTGYFAAVYASEDKLVVGGDDGSIRIVDAKTGKDSEHLAKSEFVSAFSLSRDGRKIAYGNHDFQVKVVDEGRIIQTTFNGHENLIFDLDFSDDGTSIASCSTDGTVRYWDMKSNDSHVMNHFASGIRFGSQSQVLIAGGNWYQHEIRIWDSRLRRSFLFPPNGVNLSTSCFAVSPIGSFLATGTSSGVAEIWDLVGQTVVTKLFHERLQSMGNNAIAFGPNARQIAIAYGRVPWDEGKTIIWNRESGNEVAALQGYRRLVMSMAFSPDGKTLATGGWRDGSVRLWSTSDGRPIRWYTIGPDAAGIFKLSFASDGEKLLALGANGRLYCLRMPEPVISD